MFGRVSKMNRLDCVRESLRLALREVAPGLPEAARPAWWARLWERYVESQADYRASSETLARKLVEAGADAQRLLGWLAEQSEEVAQGEQARLLARVFGEQFEVKAVESTAPQPKSKEPVVVMSGAMPPSPPAGAQSAAAQPGEALPGGVKPPTERLSSPASASAEQSPAPPSPEPSPEPQGFGEVLEPKGKGQLDSNRVQNPHDPDATYAVKGQGDHKKEHVGYKVQVAESVCEATLAPGEPTRNFIVGILTHPAYQSDEAGALLMETEQAAMGLEPPPVQYVDGAYISAEKLVEAKAQGRELIGPAQPALQKDGRFSAEDFQINVEERTAVCPAGKTNTQCSRLEAEASGKVSYRFEFSTHCHDCPLRERCLGKEQRHRTLVVGEHHTALQARRQEQKTEPFKARMKHRNAIEGTQSELVRAHGLRRARYRGLAKVRLQNYFVGAACNVKRWLRLEAWKLRQAMSAGAAETASAAAL